MKTAKILILLLWISAVGPLSAAVPDIKISHSLDLSLKVDFRAYALNDQRIYWSGVEFSFGAEAVIDAVFRKRLSWGEIRVENQLFINQPFGKNVLTDEGRKRYLPNYELDTFELSKMNIQLQTGILTVKFGKGETPFGRYSFPVFHNNPNFGSPFIRSEAILWRETGLFVNVKWGAFSLDVAAVNGEENRDTNSGKSGVFRLGLEGKHWRIGASAKDHDGHGSEWQKLFNRHIGFDLMVRFGDVEFSGEVIWDEYGFHREFDENEIFWPSSIYYRDIFYKRKEPIQGFGWYVNAKFSNESWLFNLNYGEYTPEEIGNIYHDNKINRFILKLMVSADPNLSFYFTGVLENTKPEEGWRQGAKGIAGLLGVQFSL